MKEKNNQEIPSLQNYLDSISDIKSHLETRISHFNSQQELVTLKGSLNDISQINYASLEQEALFKDEGL